MKNGKSNSKDILRRFGPYLERQRRARKMSIREFARLVKMPHTNLYQMESTGKNPRLTELAALAKACQQPLHKFLEPIV
jgi:transcriptional regulator with XRE-family HTH domain